jgi:hypothetical protein
VSASCCYMSEIKHKYFASIATKYSLAYNYIITFTTCFSQCWPSSGKHYILRDHSLHTRTSQHTQIHGDCQPQTHHVHDMKILNINYSHRTSNGTTKQFDNVPQDCVRKNCVHSTRYSTSVRVYPDSTARSTEVRQ